MRWFVEISSLGKSGAAPESRVVEAPQWQNALRIMRLQAGLDDALRNFSIEVLENGVHAVDPINRLRYVVRQESVEAAESPGSSTQKTESVSPPSGSTTAKMPSIPPSHADSVPAQKSESAPPRQSLKTAFYSSPGAASVQESFKTKSIPPPAIPHDRIPAPPANAFTPPPGAVAPSPAPRPSSHPAPLAPMAAAPVLPDHQVVVARQQEPAPGSPLTYREYAYAVSPSMGEAEMERLILAKFEEVKRQLEGAPRGKLVNLAVFDHAFETRPLRAPCVALVWKDWRSKEPELHYPGRPGASVLSPSLQSISTAQTAATGSAPSIARAAQAIGSATTDLVNPTVPMRMEQRAASQPPLATPAQASAQGITDVDRAAMHAGQRPAGPASSDDNAPMPRRQSTTQPATPAAMRVTSSYPPPPTVQSPRHPTGTGIEVRDTEPAVMEVVAAAGATNALPLSAQPAETVASPTIPTEKTSKDQEQDSGIDNQKKPASIPLNRPTAEELITTLFEAMHDLNFLRDAEEGADFVLALALEKFRSKAGMVHLYDINRSEFVVMRAAGPNAHLVLGGRTAERDPLVTEIMKRKRPFVLDVTKDGRVRAGRWAALGLNPNLILASAVELGGRFLGIIELANPSDGLPYTPTEINGLAYVAERFAEFVSGRGIVFDSGPGSVPK